MKKVSVKFVRLEIVRVFPRDNSVQIRLLVNDGKDNVLDRSVRLENTAEVAESLIHEVHEKMKTAHKAMPVPGDVLSGVVVVSIKDDEDVLMERMGKFLASVREKLRVANNGKLSYYDLELQVKKQVLQF